MAGALQIPFYLLGSATAGRYPGDGTLRALAQRELCINTTDQILFYLTASGALIRMPINPTLFAMLAGAAFTASPTAPTPASGDNSTKLSTTAFVQAIAQLLAPLAGPAFTGTPTAPTAQPLTNSGQLATTAYADKADAAAFSRTPVSSGNYSAVLTDRMIAYTALAAASTVTLPDPTKFPKGASVIVVDEAGAATGTLTITLAPFGSETINGASSYVIAAAYGYVQVETNGTKWTVIDSNAFSSSSLGSSNPAMDGTAAAGSASTASRSDHVHPTDTSRAPLASPALTGTPTAPTAASGDNSTKLETTAFSALYGLRGDIAQSLSNALMSQMLANLAVTASIGTTGYLKINNGTGTPVYLQWGGGTVPSSGALAITFPIAFPNVLGAVICGSRGSGGGTMLQTQTTSEIKSSFQANMNYTSSGSTAAAGGNAFYWFAIGY